MSSFVEPLPCIGPLCCVSHGAALGAGADVDTAEASVRSRVTKGMMQQYFHATCFYVRMSSVVGPGCCVGPRRCVGLRDQGAWYTKARFLRLCGSPIGGDTLKDGAKDTQNFAFETCNFVHLSFAA